MTDQPRDEQHFSFGRRPPADDPDVTLVEGPAQTFKWEWPGRGETVDHEPRPEDAPATYYEALTGKPDPNREFFITSRRILNLVVTLIALAIPVVLVGLAVVARADLQTIALLGIAGAVVGLMLKSSMPRTPFG